MTNIRTDPRGPCNGLPVKISNERVHRAYRFDSHRFAHGIQTEDVSRHPGPDVQIARRKPRHRTSLKGSMAGIARSVQGQLGPFSWLVTNTWLLRGALGTQQRDTRISAFECCARLILWTAPGNCRRMAGAARLHGFLLNRTLRIDLTRMAHHWLPRMDGQMTQADSV